MKIPKLGGVLETALYVDDLARAMAFYETIFAFEVLFADERLCALNVSNQQVLLLFRKGGSVEATITPGGVIPPNDADGELHIAFSIAADELEAWEKWFDEHRIEIESKVKWGRGGTSIYFRDPDRHLLELVTPGLWTIY